MTVRHLPSIRQSFVFCFYFYCFFSCFFLSLCFCLARNALQMSNGCELRATSKILYYWWVYNIVSLLFLTLMIVAAKEILLALPPQGIYWGWLREKCVQCQIIEWNKSLIDDMVYLLVCKTYLCKFSSWKLMNDCSSIFCTQLWNIYKFEAIFAAL